MAKFLISCFYVLMFTLSSDLTLAIEQVTELNPCIQRSHCYRMELASPDAERLLQDALLILSNMPRMEIVQNSHFYIQGKASTQWMHFEDDLEIKAIPEKGVIQFRSESRVGTFDFGVNKKRVQNLVDLLIS